MWNKCLNTSLPSFSWSILAFLLCPKLQTNHMIKVNTKIWFSKEWDINVIITAHFFNLQCHFESLKEKHAKFQLKVLIARLLYLFLFFPKFNPPYFIFHTINYPEDVPPLILVNFPLLDKEFNFCFYTLLFKLFKIYLLYEKPNGKE